MFKIVLQTTWILFSLRLVHAQSPPPDDEDLPFPQLPDLAECGANLRRELSMLFYKCILKPTSLTTLISLQESETITVY